MTIRRAKLIAALALLVSLFLPMSSCTSPERTSTDPNGVTVTYPAETTYLYAWQTFEPTKSSGYLFFLAFVWPVAATSLEHRLRGSAKTALFVVELPALVGTAYIVWVLAWGLGTTLSGGYLATAATGLYAIAWLTELGGKLRRLMPPKAGTA